MPWLRFGLRFAHVWRVRELFFSWLANAVALAVVVWIVNLVLDLAPGSWRGTRRDRRAIARRTA